MAITLQKTALYTVTVRGINLKLANRATWRKVLDKVGKDLQRRVAESFAREKVAGTRALRRNSPEWNRYKRRKGLDPRRGHATNRLQRTLEGPRLYTIGAINPQGVCVIRMREDWLRSRVPYAEYYEDAKVSGGAILALADAWVKENQLAVREFEALQIEAAAKAATTGATAARLKMLADKAERDIAARVAFARNAPFNEAVRPRYIKPTAGLSQKLMRQIGKQANALAGNRLSLLERRIEAASRRFGN